jgi:competence protein ComEC
VLTAAGLLFYGLVAAGAASVARAVTVAVVVLTCRAVDHRGASLNALAVAAIIAVAFSPVAVLDAGFILSFGATLGIILGVPRLVGPLQHHRTAGVKRVAVRIGLALTALGSATACAEIVLAPVGATLFGRVPLAGLLLNFAAIPLMTIVQTAGLLLTAAASWSDRVANAAGRAAHLGATGLLESSRLVEVAPWLTADVRPPVWWLIVGYYGCTFGLLARRTRRISALLLIILAGVMLAGPHETARSAVPRARVPLRVVILDVGQGDASVVQLPNGRALLVDAGGLAAYSTPDSQDATSTFDIGDRVVSAALRSLAVSRLDAVVITHGDPDHLLGAKGVIRRVPATSVWEGIPVPPHGGLQALASLARMQGMSWRTVQAGDLERFGDVEVRVLHPPPPDWERQRVRNEDSVVLEVRIGAVSIVLPGDIGREGERAIRPRLEPGRLVVLKAPHHGSATSSTRELLDVLRPAAVVFSCGRDNRFGHPHPAVVSRYRQLGSEIFSTAQDGAVFVETDGKQVEVWGWNSGRRLRIEGQSR